MPVPVYQLPKRILVTGGSGYLGRALCARLIDEGGVIRASVRDGMVGTTSGIELVRGELLPTFDWSLCLQDVEAVVHTAARVHVNRDRATDPLGLFRFVNVEGTKNLARQAVKAGVRRFIFISSIGVNGRQTKGKRFAELDPENPSTPYAISKYEAEQGLAEIVEGSKTELTILRPPLIYGPGAPGNFGALVHAVARKWPLPLGLVTSNLRSFVAIDNLVDFIVTCLSHPAAANQTFLVSDGEDVSTADFLRRLGSAMGTPARLIPVPVGLLALGVWLIGRSEIFHSLCGSLQVDISKARKLLGWEPPMRLDESLKKAVGGILC